MILTGPALLASSDTGALDGITSINQPAFAGTAEPNALVRIYADGLLVGQGVATSAGDYEITVEPLTDGAHVITAQAEDLAGNLSVGGRGSDDHGGHAGPAASDAGPAGGQGLRPVESGQCDQRGQPHQLYAYGRRGHDGSG